jgi:aminocarboxymuconate-semialdehyde decarboxylase
MDQPSKRDLAADVYTHAMPMPVLRWLADLGLADVSGAAEEVTRLDSRVSGVGDRVPLPLARSQHWRGEPPDLRAAGTRPRI